MSGEADTAYAEPADSGESSAFIEIGVIAPGEAEEKLADFLIDNVTGGSGLVLENVGDDVLIRLYIPDDADAEVEKDKISRFLIESGLVDAGSACDRISSKRVREIDWLAEYRKSFEPIEIGDVVVRSTRSDAMIADKLVINIEPKMAFGTGKHETTQLCVHALRRAVKGGETVIDLGTGSGILAILAAMLGADSVLGLDLDPVAVDNARENVSLNGVADIVTVEYGSMQKITVQNHYDIVVSNLIRDGIFELFDDFVRVAKPGGIMILSGILTDQTEQMSRFFERRGCFDFDVTMKNEWACYVLRV